LQREQKERAEREQQEVDDRQVLDQLSEEQREELNEAVSLDTYGSTNAEDCIKATADI
jgi:hypothetical protein